MSELPQGWLDTTFGAIADIKLGKMLDQAKNRGEPTSYLRNVNVRWGHIDLTDILEMPMSSMERASLDIQDGDLMICEGGEPGRAAVWDQGANSLSFQKALMRMRPFGGINSHLLAAYLRNISSSGELQSYFTGTTIKHLPQQALSCVQVPLPPLPEQQRIIEKVDSLSAKSARARDHLDHIPRLVEKYKRAVLAAAFRGDLTREWRIHATSNRVSVDALEERRKAAWSTLSTQSRYSDPDEIDWRPDIDLPAGWEWASVDQLSFLIQYGTSAKTSDDGNGVAVLRMGNLQDGELDSSSLKYLPSDHGEFPKLLLQPGDVLFNRTNSAELVGKTAVYVGEPHHASFASYLIRIKMCGLKPRLLSAYINSAIGREWVASVVNQQVGQANVNGTKLRRLGVPVMPTDEQSEIEASIRSAFTWIDRLAKEATSAHKLVDCLDQAVLAKAFRGELVPQDPNDEPASVLLERIKAERAEAIPQAGRRGRVRKMT
jgi:type I restriction enzyme, S subunit